MKTPYLMQSQASGRYWFGFWVLMSCLQVSGATSPSMIRLDINGNTRADMRRESWHAWNLTVAKSAVTSIEGVEFTLRPVNPSHSLKPFARKALVADGLTLGADGVQVAAETGAGLELRIAGLPPGEHSLTTYHHTPDPQAALWQVKMGQQPGVEVKSAEHPTHDDLLASAHLRFSLEEGEEAVIRMEPLRGHVIPLNALVLGSSDPAHKALIPVPADMSLHADGDDGWVRLAWRAAPDAIAHRIHWVADRDPSVLADRLQNHSQGEPVHASHHRIPVSRDSSLYYGWRVDSLNQEGVLTRGDIWYFRVRHPAFPSAQGHGRFAIGGRGGRVMHVTHLGDSGPGSFREAVEAEGPRTVVFDVSGLITLKSKLIFGKNNAFLTVAGQTAPGKGICLRNYSFGGVGARDTIIRYMRLRLGDLAGQTMDGMGLASSDHCIIDHCSISWTQDEAFSSRGARHITLQHSLISEALNIAGHRKYPEGTAHGYAGSIGGDIGSFHHNLLAHNAGRNWSLAGSIDQANRHAGRLDIRNMVVYNWSHRTTDGGARQVQFVNNYYKPGPASKILTYLNPQFENPSFGPQQYYVEGNVMEGVVGPEGPLLPLQGMAIRGEQPWPALVTTPFFESLVQTQSAQAAYRDVLQDVGCNVPQMDDHDRRIIRETREGNFTYRGSRSGLPGLPDSQDDVGGWEAYPEVHRPHDWDTDGDGMPNHWELAKGLNPEDPHDGQGDPDGDGYTSLEDYLNSLPYRRP